MALSQSSQENKLHKARDEAERAWPAANGKGGHFPSQSWLPRPYLGLCWNSSKCPSDCPSTALASLPPPRPVRPNNSVCWFWRGLFVSPGQGGRVEPSQGLSK